MKLFEDNMQVVRFATVGVTVAVFYVIAYAGLIAFGLPEAPANVTAFLAAIVVQYTGQTLWTFQRPFRQNGQWVRFAAMITIGLIFSTWITTSIAPRLNWSAVVAATVVAVSLPCINFLMMRFWVYQATEQDEDK